MFHELRSLLDNISDEEELFKKVFSALFRYNFVEGGIVYKKEKASNSYASLIRYGVSNVEHFPEKIEKREYPLWLQMMLKEGAIITPKVENKQFIIAIPISENPWKEEQNYIIVIERIRYTMQTSETEFALKIMSLLLRYILERRLLLLSKKILDYSVVQETLIYKPGPAEKLLRIRLKMFKKAGVPYILAFLTLKEPSPPQKQQRMQKKLFMNTAVKEEIAPEVCRNLLELGKSIDTKFRVVDEKYFIDNKLFLLFTFADDFQSIYKKIETCSCLKDLKEVPGEGTQQIVGTGNFNNVGNH
ncbi:MAG: hypothetical protein D3924_00390 [Candidatus Electrothrix sp. AR4]|nr:hypothetical protein [Candidatus Electrothrix sp. AR4]